MELAGTGALRGLDKIWGKSGFWRFLGFWVVLWLRSEKSPPYLSKERRDKGGAPSMVNLASENESLDCAETLRERTISLGFKVPRQFSITWSQAGRMGLQ